MSNHLATNDGKLIIVSGSSRCGKTAKSIRMARGFQTVFVWDIQAQWSKVSGYVKVTDLVQLKNIVKQGKRGKFAFVSSGNIKDDFEKFCACVYFYAEHFGVCCMVAEELADVTNVGKAGLHWGIITRRGLKLGLTIIAISQRWNEADKTAFGNGTDYYLFRQSNDLDIKYISARVRVDRDRLASLKPLEYLHYDALTQTVTGSKVTFN